MALSEEDKEWIGTQLQRVETDLLTAFHKWASPMDLRQRSRNAIMRMLDVEIEALQERVKKLEPPAA